MLFVSFLWLFLLKSHQKPKQTPPSYVNKTASWSSPNRSAHLAVVAPISSDPIGTLGKEKKSARLTSEKNRSMWPALVAWY
jgi:hypothetical protein